MSAIRELTRVSPNLRKVAALLQSKGRYGDTLLAHITPREAQMLKDAGGAGTTNPDTGLLEFYDWAGSFEDPSSADVDYSQYGAPPPDTSFSYGGPQASAVSPQEFEQAVGASYLPTQPWEMGMRQQEMAPLPTPAMPAAPSAAPFQMPVPEVPQPPGLSREGRQTLTQLGVAGIQTLPAMLAARRATAGGRGAAQQQQQLAQPYQQMGRQLQAQAQAGQLTPQGQQALQAARAQLAQGVQARGGVGAQQAATQLESFRQNLLQQQMDYALKLANFGDQIAMGAIRTGMQADQYVNNLTQQFFSNLMRVALPQPGGTPPGGP